MSVHIEAIEDVLAYLRGEFGKWEKTLALLGLTHYQTKIILQVIASNYISIDTLEFLNWRRLRSHSIVDCEYIYEYAQSQGYALICNDAN